MMNNKMIEEILVSPSHNALISFQSYIRKNELKPQEIRMIQRAFTSSLKEKEKANCDLILEAIQVFIQRYHKQLLEWLYILIVQLTHRLSSALVDSHIRALQETTDLIRNLFSQRLLLQLSCKFVMDSVHIINTKIKCTLLQFIRVLIVSSKPTILDDIFPDLIMAVSRIISWTADIKSVNVRKESERVIQKLFYLNPERFSTILKSLPSGFQERAKIILKGNILIENANKVPEIEVDTEVAVVLNNIESKRIPETINFTKSEGIYPKPGIFNKPQTGYLQNIIDTNDDSTFHKGIGSSFESIPNVMPGNSATVTYRDIDLINKNFKRRNNKFEECLHLEIEELSDKAEVKKSRTHKSKKSKHCKIIKLPVDEDRDSTKEQRRSKHCHKRATRSKHVKDNPAAQVDQSGDMDETLTKIENELSRFNERHQERKLSLLTLIRCTNSSGGTCWDSHFKTIMSLLLETLGDNEGGTRKLALVSIQELAKVEPGRFQDQIGLIVDKLLHCFLDSDQGVIEAVRSCAFTLSCCLNVDTLWRTLNSTIVENEKNIQSVGLKFISYVIRGSTPVIVSCLLVETLTLLQKFTRDKDMLLRKNSIYCLITLYKKVGDKIWPHLKNFEKTTVRLLQIYIHRL